MCKFLKLFLKDLKTIPNDITRIRVFVPISSHWGVSSPYGARRDPITGKKKSFHYGTDFAVPEGTPIRAAVDGKIFKSGWQDAKNHKKGFGKRVWQTAKINGKKYYVFYAHLSGLSVDKGQTVREGDIVGYSGNTGRSSGPHLHFEVRETKGKGVAVTWK